MRIVETMQKADWPAIISRVTGVALLLAGMLLAAGLCTATPQANSVPSIFDSHSTPRIRSVISLTSSRRHRTYFLVVFSLLSYVVVKFAAERRTQSASQRKCMEARRLNLPGPSFRF